MQQPLIRRSSRRNSVWGQVRGELDVLVGRDRRSPGGNQCPTFAGGTPRGIARRAPCRLTALFDRMAPSESLNAPGSKFSTVGRRRKACASKAPARATVDGLFASKGDRRGFFSGCEGGGPAPQPSSRRNLHHRCAKSAVLGAVISRRSVLVAAARSSGAEDERTILMLKIIASCRVLSSSSRHPRVRCTRPDASACSAGHRHVAPENIFPFINVSGSDGVIAVWRDRPGDERTWAPKGAGPSRLCVGRHSNIAPAHAIVDSSTQKLISARLPAAVRAHNIADSLCAGGDSPNVTWSLHGPCRISRKSCLCS